MIKISVDEAAAYDMLSILSVKYRVDRANYPALSELACEIEESIGGDLYSDVLASEEYESLHRVNCRVFELIDDLRSSGEKPGDAMAIDAANYERYLCKKRLQAKWFPTSELTERKIGYDDRSGLTCCPTPLD